VARHDLHMRMPQGVLQRIDDHRGTRTRTQYVIDAINHYVSTTPTTTIAHDESFELMVAGSRPAVLKRGPVDFRIPERLG
jgi:hypothetical protein